MNTRYLDEFLRLNCVSDVLDRKFIKNAKDISESLAILNVLRRYLGIPRMEDPFIQFVEYECGAHPHVSGIAAFVTRWKCVAADPLLPERYYNVARFSVGRASVTEYTFSSRDLVILAAVAPTIAVRKALDTVDAPEVILVNLTHPNGLVMTDGLKHDYVDEGILSTNSRVLLYHYQGDRKWTAAEGD